MKNDATSQRDFIPVRHWCRLQNEIAVAMVAAAAWASGASAQCDPANLFDAPILIDTQDILVNGVSSGDVNADGHLDLVATTQSHGLVLLYLGTGDGNFHTPIQYAASLMNGLDVDLQQPQIIDFNADGYNDVLFWYHAPLVNSGLGLMLNDGEGNLIAGSDYINLDAGSYANYSTSQFFPESGVGVLMLQPDQDRFTLFVAQADGISGPVNDWVRPGEPAGSTPADFDNDGNMDFLITFNASDEVTPYRNAGNGTFTELPSVEMNSPQAISSGDFNGDGLDDIAVLSPPNSQLQVLMNSGSGFTPQPEPILLGAHTSSDGEVVISDINADGYNDILTYFSDSQTIYVLINNQGSGFLPQVSLETGEIIQAISVADVNSDGAIDLIMSSKQVSASEGTNAIHIYINQCANGHNCQADLTGDAQLNFFDVSRFLVMFSTGDPGADFHADGSLNFFDVSQFLTLYSAGCP